MRRVSIVSSLPLLVGFILLFCAAISTVFLARQQRSIDAQIRHTLEVDNDLQHIQNLVTDAEAGQRGYLLTGRLSYLDPYELAKHELPRAFDQLAPALAENSAAPELAELRDAIAKKLMELQSTIDLRAANNAQAALVIVNNDSGKKYMARIREILADLREAQHGVLENRSAEAAELNDSRGTILLVSVLLVIALGLGTWIESRRRLRQLRLANDELHEEAAERRAAEMQVRQLQKMEAVGQLTGGIAHDFNNMLAIIIGSLDMARRKLFAAEYAAVDKYIAQAGDGAQRAAVLTSRLLAFSRQQPLEPKVFDVNRLVGGMSELAWDGLAEVWLRTPRHEQHSLGIDWEADLHRLHEPSPRHRHDRQPLPTRNPGHTDDRLIAAGDQWLVEFEQRPVHRHE